MFGPRICLFKFQSLGEVKACLVGLELGKSTCRMVSTERGGSSSGSQGAGTREEADTGIADTNIDSSRKILAPPKESGFTCMVM